MTMGIRTVIAAGAALLLCACGGGGGGGDSAPFYGIKFAPASVAFSANEDDPTPTSQVVIGTAYAQSTLYVKPPVVQGAGIDGADLQIQPDGTAKITVTPSNPAALGGGTFHATISVAFCFDAFCNSPYSNSPAVLPITYTVKAVPRLS